MCLSAFTFGQNIKNFVEEITYSPEHTPEPMVAVADMLTIAVDIFCSAKVACFVAIIINVIIFVKGKLFVARNELFTD